MNLIEFLQARITEDEALWTLARDAKARLVAEHASSDAYVPTAFAEKLLADCFAKQRIVQDLEGRLQDEASDPEDIRLVWAATVARETLWSLAFPYSDHPDFNYDEWHP